MKKLKSRKAIKTVVENVTQKRKKEIEKKLKKEE
jgi:hypothetical protein